MAVYRNLQEQVFENAKDIEQLQNKNQHVQENENVFEVTVPIQTPQIDFESITHISGSMNGLSIYTGNQNPSEGPLISIANNTAPSGSEIYATVSDKNNPDNVRTFVDILPNDIWTHSQNGNHKSDLHLDYNDLRFYNTTNDESSTWSAMNQIVLNKKTQSLSGKYIIDSYTIDEATQTINFTLTQL